MQVERLKILEEYANSEPEDPFNHYALAIELIKSDSNKAIELFEFLLSKFPDYLPTYYQFGVLLTSLEKYEKAKEVFGLGIALAKLKKDERTEKELKGALQIVMDELTEW
jgi:tetratricopeptide (TPR) repeat protein